MFFRFIKVYLVIRNAKQEQELKVVGDSEAVSCFYQFISQIPGTRSFGQVKKMGRDFL